ncbi:MAG: hypothetical protein GEV09_26425 [Pseudonocardiaceae bacterium]|nr:hypothetical protein [Pseudonocardiaceae bacterium]
MTRRATETLAVAEAREQGYLACTSCRPDAVLAARTEDETETETETGGSAAETGDGEAAAERVPVTVVTGQRRYHLRGCQVLQDAEEDDAETVETTPAAARGEGLTPCRVCGAPEGDPGGG